MLPQPQLRRHPDAIRYTLLALFCWQRRRMIIDGLIELLGKGTQRFFDRLSNSGPHYRKQGVGDLLRILPYRDRQALFDGHLKRLDQSGPLIVAVANRVRQRIRQARPFLELLDALRNGLELLLLDAEQQFFESI